MATTVSSESNYRLGTNPARPTKMHIDEMLQNYCGEFGPWQLKQFILTSIAWILMAFHSMVMIFADREPHWNCLDNSSCDAASHNVCSLQTDLWEWTGGRGSSTVSEWGLICSEKYKVGLVHSLFFVGSLIGQFTFFNLFQFCFLFKQLNNENVKI